MQNIQNHTARVVFNAASKLRFVIVDESIRIPLEIASLGAGTDAWLREVKAKCRNCEEAFTLAELFSEVPEHCSACSEKFYATMEN